MHKVLVVGFTSTTGGRDLNNTGLAYTRAKSVLETLQAVGISGEVRAESQDARQRKEELDHGLQSFRRAEIRLSSLACQEGYAAL